MTTFLKAIRSTALVTGLTLALAPALWAAGLDAQTDVDTVAVGDSFRLVLSGDAAQVTAAPDLAPLSQDFDVLSTAQSRQTQIINGSRSDSLQWTVTLVPKGQGAVTIPAIHAGAASSDPLTLQVLDPAQMPAVTVPGAPEITVTVGDGAYYVQQEIPVTVRITSGPNLQSADLVLPQSSDFTLTQTGPDRTVQNTANGPKVLERTYLLRPQKSGSLTLPPLALKARLSDPEARSPFANSPFGTIMGGSPFAGRMADPFAQMMNPSKEVTVRSAPVVLDVKADPSGAGWFLPAKNVQIIAAWAPENPVFKAGEAVQRRIQVMALGANDVQLPDLDVGTAEGLRIYLDGSDAKTVDTPDGTASVREFRYSVVPIYGGTVTLPEVRLHWFDTGAEEARTAVLPAEVITVSGAPAPIGVVAPQEPATVSQIETAPPVHGYGKILLGAAIVAMITSAVAAAWYRLGRTAASSNLTAPAFAKQRAAALAKAEIAARDSDTKALYDAVRAWLSAACPDPSRLKQVLATLYPDLDQAWGDLEKQVFGTQADPAWRPAALIRHLRDADRKVTGLTQRHHTRKPVLGPLYDLK